MEHWYDNEISRGILAAKYYHEGETMPQQFIDRVSSVFKGDFRERMKKYIKAIATTAVDKIGRASCRERVYVLV